MILLLLTIEQILQCPNALKVSHSTYKWALQCILWINLNWLFKLGPNTIFILNLNWKRHLEYFFELYVKISQVIFENIRYFIWIWNNAFDLRSIITQLHLTDYWWKRFLQQRYDEWRRIFLIWDENRISASLLCTSVDKGFRTTVADADAMNSGMMYIFPDQLNDRFGFFYCSICEKEQLLWVSRMQILIEYPPQCFLNLGSSQSCVHLLDF